MSVPVTPTLPPMSPKKRTTSTSDWSPMAGGKLSALHVRTSAEGDASYFPVIYFLNWCFVLKATYTFSWQSSWLIMIHDKSVRLEILNSLYWWILNIWSLFVSDLLSPKPELPGAAGDSVRVQPLEKYAMQDIPQQQEGATAQISKHILTVKSFNKNQLHQIFNLAHHYRLCVMRERSLDHVLKGKVSSREVFFLAFWRRWLVEISSQPCYVNQI